MDIFGVKRKRGGHFKSDRKTLEVNQTVLVLGYANRGLNQAQNVPPLPDVIVSDFQVVLQQNQRKIDLCVDLKASRSRLRVNQNCNRASADGKWFIRLPDARERKPRNDDDFGKEHHRIENMFSVRCGWSLQPIKYAASVPSETANGDAGLSLLRIIRWIRLFNVSRQVAFKHEAAAGGLVRLFAQSVKRVFLQLATTGLN